MRLEFSDFEWRETDFKYKNVFSLYWQDDALLKLNEDELCEMQKVNSIQYIQRMRISPLEESQFHILLCRMVYMPLVRPTLANDIKRLEAEFTHGYRPGAPMFYVSICNDKGGEQFVKDVDTSNWGPHGDLS
jgi:hypothetical protein